MSHRLSLLCTKFFTSTPIGYLARASRLFTYRYINICMYMYLYRYKRMYVHI